MENNFKRIKKKCKHPNHNPPELIYIPKGEYKIHKCPSCKQEQVIQGVPAIDFFSIMKKILLIFLFTINYSFSQNCSSYYIDPKLIVNENSKLGIPNSPQGGSCSSPDGPMLSVISPPPSYAWLNSNGYCYSIGPTKNFTTCFTFTATGTNINLNAGYSSTGCASISFSGFNLYKCFPSCVLVGSGLSFIGLIPGQCYTWCFSGSCTGPGPGFDHICPYFQDVTPLPIQLLSFNCSTFQDGIKLEWSTATEQNNKEFIIEYSKDGINFNELKHVKGIGTTLQQQNYVYYDYFCENGTSYYRLKQVDYNGYTTTYNIIACEYQQPSDKTFEYYDITGRQLNSLENLASGIYFIRFNGEFKKIVK